MNERCTSWTKKKSNKCSLCLVATEWLLLHCLFLCPLKHQAGATRVFRLSLGIQKVCTKSYKSTSVKRTFTKLLSTDCCRWQNFRPSLLRLVDRLYTVIHKKQKSKAKIYLHLNNCHEPVCQRE